MTAVRTYTVLGCAAAAGVALFAATRTWVVETAVRAAPLPPLVTTHTGGSLSPALPALALVALAGAGGLLATRGTGRRVVALLVVAAGAALAVLAATNLGRAGVAVGWVLLTIIAGIGVVAAGVVALRRGAAWPGLGTRYERAASERAATAERLRRSDRADGPDQPDGEIASQVMWDAIERGEDPTKS